MKAFQTIAVPHDDVLEGKVQMDVYAADLWQAFHGSGPEVYRDKDLFFHKTYFTDGLNNLISVIENRIKGNGGDPVIQIQTPFGGGKTHSLIAIMHMAKEWNANRVVIVGTNLSASESTDDLKLWEIIEQQLTGKVEILKSNTSPGKDKIRALLVKYEPVVILIDELLEYFVKASGVKIGESTLAGQTLAFLQELSETVSAIEKACLIITLPSSFLEKYDHNLENYLAQIQKIVGRLEKIYTPVNELEIAKVIRKRLFKSIDEEEISKQVKNIMDYFEKENLFPSNTDSSKYRERFKDSYPFLPDVIETLYHRWGSYPTFQRTRGVLRILSMVIHKAIKEARELPYISLSDFDLSDINFRRELIKHIGQEFDSVIAQDITDTDAGSRKIDDNLGDSLRGLKIATRSSTAIFMYSFSGGIEKGATLLEIKRNATKPDIPSSIILEAIEQLKNKLYFLQFSNDKYFFNNKPNLNRMLIDKKENIHDREILEKELELIKKQLSNKYFKSYIWEEDAENIPDDQELKLIILREEKKDVIDKIIKTKGAKPRVNCNTLIFLCPNIIEYNGLHFTIIDSLAYKKLLSDDKITLEPSQKKDLEDKLKNVEKECLEKVLRAYQKVLYSTKDSLTDISLGIPAHGENKKLEERVFEKLKGAKLVEFIAPLVLSQKYIGQNDYISTKALRDTFYRTPGEIMLVNQDALKKSIESGVQQGEFGLGKLIDDKIGCNFYKTSPIVTFDDNEILINAKICEQLLQSEKSKETAYAEEIAESEPARATSEIISYEKAQSHETSSYSHRETKKRINITFEVPFGRYSDINRMLTNISSNLEKVFITIIGELTEHQYENTVKETLKQLNISYKENE